MNSVRPSRACEGKTSIIHNTAPGMYIKVAVRIPRERFQLNDNIVHLTVFMHNKIQYLVQKTLTTSQ
jgi:hypothetical protein